MNDDFDEIVADIDDQLDLTIYADIDELAEEVTSQVLLAIENGLLAQGKFHLVLTGGTLGVQISEHLKSAWNAAPEMYKGLHVYWSDERFVDLESSERNAAPLHTGLTNSNIEIHEALAPNSPASIDDAVSHYENLLRNVTIDLNILGLGPDGHGPGHCAGAPRKMGWQRLSGRTGRRLGGRSFVGGSRTPASRRSPSRPTRSS